MAIMPNEVHDDADLARRVLAYARTVAPCLQTLEGDDREDALAILKAVAPRVQSFTAGLKTRRAGDWSWEYFSDAELGGFFGLDDRATLAALCAASTAPRGPLGSFPEPYDYSRVFR